MRGSRFSKKAGSTYKVGFKPKERIAVEKIVGLTQGIFEAAPVLTTLAVFVDAQQEFSDEIGDALESMGLAEEYTQQMHRDHENWVTRLSHYAAWINRAIDGEDTFWISEDGDVVDADSASAELEMDAEDFLDQYVAQPLLYGNAYTIPAAEIAEDRSGAGYAGVPDIGTGFSLVNQINAVGNVFDDATLLEKRFGIWLEIAAQIKQSEWAQDYADELQFVFDSAGRAIENVSDFVDEVIEKGAGILIGLALAGVVAYAVTKGAK